MPILCMGIDASPSNIGVAICESSGRLIFRHTIQTSHDDSAQSIDLCRMRAIHDGMRSIIQSFQSSLGEIRTIAIEGMAFKMMGRIGQIGGAHWIVQVALWNAWREFAPCMPMPKIQEIGSPRCRKLILGASIPANVPTNRVKKWLLARMQQIRLPVGETDHENDAIIVALAGAVEMNLRIAAFPPSKEILGALHQSVMTVAEKPAKKPRTKKPAKRDKPDPDLIPALSPILKPIRLRQIRISQASSILMTGKPE